MKILFPSEPFALKVVDSSFKEEYEAAKLIGFDVYLYDHDEYVKNDVLKTTLPVRETNPEDIVLRGWMFEQYKYKSFYTSVLVYGYQLINGPSQYVECHHLPEYYKYISEYTSKCWWSNTWSEHPGFQNTRSVSWEPVRMMLGGDVIIKDYVKSEKGIPGLFILNKELTNEEFADKVQQFVDARGKLFNKGLVFKSVEKLKKYAGQTNEWRIFFVDILPVKITFNCEQKLDVPNPPEEFLSKIYTAVSGVPSRFFTVDVAEKEDGSWMVLEMGDGQVSGLAAQEESIKFYNNLFNILTGQEVE